ncbi:MAG: hypothetical protein J7647_27570 [Cyanobacteria bacterium SBLK]|nr:hypothetical protein [Cyanobacteria bacterium SBLK]
MKIDYKEFEIKIFRMSDFNKEDTDYCWEVFRDGKVVAHNLYDDAEDAIYSEDEAIVAAQRKSDSLL